MVSSDSDCESEPQSSSNASLENGTANIQGKQPMMFGMRGMLPETVEVTDLQLVSVIDGTPVWDENDDSPENQVVRSLDAVTYNLRMAIQEPEVLTRENETDRIEFMTVIPGVKLGEIAFLTDSMDWLKNPNVKETEDGLVLSGYTYVDADAEGVYWQNISVKLVAAMDDGAEFTPSFYARVEGQENYVSVVDSFDPEATIQVVAKEALNVSLQFDSSTNNKFYDIPTATGAVESTYGYMMGLTLRMEVMSENNSLKGVKLPKGDFEFDIDLSVLDGSNVDATAEHLPVLWDYHQAKKDEIKTGYLGRELEPKVNGRSLLPYGKYDETTNTLENSVYDSGNIHVELEDTTLHVKISEYAFSPELTFPQYTQYGNTYGTGSGKGAFSVAMIQLFVPVPYKARNTVFTLKAVQRDLLLGGQPIEQKDTTDDVATSHLQETAGGWNRHLIYAHEGELNIKEDRIEFASAAVSGVNNGNFYAYPGEKLTLMGTFSDFEELNFNGLDYLVKVPDIVELPELEDVQVYKAARYRTASADGLTTSYPKTESPFDEYKISYAVRENSWGIGDEADRLIDDTLMHELKYYDDKATAEENGEIVGLLFELRDGVEYNRKFRVVFIIPVTIKSSAANNIGYVYPTCHETMAYQLSESFNGIGMTIDHSIRHYNDENLDSTNEKLKSMYSTIVNRANVLVSGVSSCNEDGINMDGIFHTYKKSVYKDGQVISGNTSTPHSLGQFAGTSLVIVGAQTTVEGQVEQKNENDEARVIYSLNQGQREVDYAINPRYEFTFENNLEDEVDTLVITSILDKGLTYKPESAFQGGSYDAETEELSGGIRLEPEISTDSSGRTVLTWRLEDRKTGEEIETIHYSCLIDETVTDGTQLKNTVRITCSSDVRPVNTFTRKESVTSIQVAQSQGSVLAKHVDRYYAELKDTVTYDLTFNNNGSVDYEDVLLRDILPYEGDGRGTDFKGGTYKVTGISGVDLTNDEIYISKLDPQDLIEIKLEDMYMDTACQTYWSGWTKYQDGDNLDGVTAIAWRGKAEANEEIAIKIEIEIECPVTRAVFANNAEAYTIAVKKGDHQKLTSLKVKTTVLPRKLSGLAWFDADRDGIRETEETLLAGVKVTLVDQSGSAVNDIYGNPVNAYVTGADGTYQFDNLAAGEYQVRFESDTYKLDELLVAVKDSATAGDEWDSDADGVYEDETLKAAVISGIKLPELSAIVEKNLDEWHEAHLDAGFHSPEQDETESDPTESNPTESDPSESESNEPESSEPESSESETTEPETSPSIDDDEDEEPERTERPTQPTEPTSPVAPTEPTLPTETVTDQVPETETLPYVDPNATPDEIPEEVVDAYYERYRSGDIEPDDIPVGVLGAFFEKGFPMAVLPATGERSMFWIWMMLVSLVGLAVTSVLDRKRTK